VISKTSLYLHNLKTLEISGPYDPEKSDELCSTIESLALPIGEWMITEHITEIFEKDYSNTLNMWRFKEAKKKKKGDVDGEASEVTKGLPKIITGEVIG